MKFPSIDWVSAIIVLSAGLVMGYLIGSLRTTFRVVTSDPSSGRFLGDPRTKWLPDGRDMELLEDFVFIDSSARAWTAEKGCKVNGASIPKPFWSIIGGPFEGQYRNASIVHDAECDRKTALSVDVHRMFYDACRCGGVPEKKAKLLYWAVANYGPSWSVVSRASRETPFEMANASLEGVPEIFSAQSNATKEPTAEEIEWAKAFFEAENPNIEMVPYLKPPAKQLPGSASNPKLPVDKKP
jgi:Protein of unknown function (DUF1353)